MTNSCIYNQITHPRQIVPVTYQTMLVNRDPALAIVKRFPDFFHTQIIPLTEHAARLHHHAFSHGTYIRAQLRQLAEDIGRGALVGVLRYLSNQI